MKVIEKRERERKGEVWLICFISKQFNNLIPPNNDKNIFKLITRYKFQIKIKHNKFRKFKYFKPNGARVMSQHNLGCSNKIKKKW